jgi:hypothetical protein
MLTISASTRWAYCKQPRHLHRVISRQADRGAFIAEAIRHLAGHDADRQAFGRRIGRGQPNRRFFSSRTATASRAACEDVRQKRSSCLG